MLQQRQKIKELFLEQRRVRLSKNQTKPTSNFTKLGQTLKCFSLQKNSSEHLSSLKKVSKQKSYHLVKTPTKKQMQNLAKLVDLYQSQKSKRSNSSDKNLSRVKVSQNNYKTQRNFTFLGKLPEEKSTPTLALRSQNQGSRPSFLREPLFGNSQKSLVSNIFPSQLYVHRPVRENVKEQRSQSMGSETDNVFEAVMRRAFIPASKLKNSPRRMFFEKSK